MRNRGFSRVCSAACTLIAAALICMAAVTVSAAELSEPSYDENAGGYQIGTMQELYWFAALVNGTLSDTEQNAAANAVLTADITINANLLDDNGELNGDTFEQWTPMADTSNRYAGTFDGAGHTISGLYIESENSFVGMFTYVTGEVKNLTISDSYVSGAGRVGALCGLVASGGSVTDVTVTGSSIIGTGDRIGAIAGGSNGALENVKVSGSTISGNADVGAICGYSNSSTSGAQAENNSVSGTDKYVGGLVGYVTGGTVTDSTISDSYVSSTSTYVGGVVGYVTSSGTVTNTAAIDNTVKGESTYVGGAVGYVTGSTVADVVVNGGTVSGTQYVGGAVGYSTGVIQSVSVEETAVTGTSSYVGGVCGLITGTNVIGGTSAAASMDACSFSGSVTGGTSYTGGIVGQSGSGCTVTNSFNTGSVTGGTATGTGGVAGMTSGTIENCYNLGSVTSGGGDRVGGICGTASAATITNCYNAGTVTNSGSYTGSVCGCVQAGLFGGTYSAFTNCYYNADINTNFADVGYYTSSSATLTEVEGKTTAAFNSGEVAWLLQGGEAELVWGQSLGADEYPILSDDDSEKVIKITFVYTTDDSTEDAYTNYGCVFAAYPTSADVEYAFYTDEGCTDEIDTAEYTYTADMSVYVAEAKKALGVTLIDGAQIRIGDGVTADNRTGDESGLRFIAIVDQRDTVAADADTITLKDGTTGPHVGIAIFDGGFPTADEVDDKIAALTDESKPISVIPAEIYQDVAKSVFTAAVVNIDPANYNRVYIAVPYAVVGGVRQYDFDEAVARSPYQVAAGLLVEGKTTEGYEQSASSAALNSVLNAYANETGARITLTYSASEGFVIGEAEYAGEAVAFFKATCEEIKDDDGEVIGTKVTLTGESGDVLFYDYWSEYIRINKNTSTAVKHIDMSSAKIEEVDGKSTLTFDFYIDTVTQ